MGIVIKPTDFTDGVIPTAAQFDGDFDTIYSEFNGGITNANISASAAIAYSKLNLTGSIQAADLASGVANADGWIVATGSWAYASASTITVPSGAASLYQKGDRIKWTQTTVKYGVIVAVADTLLTIAVNTDYVVANAAISAIYYSHQANPLGYPGHFNYTLTLAWTAGTAPSGSPITKYTYQIINHTVFLNVYGYNYTAGATVTSLSVPLPVPTLSGSRGLMGNGYIGVGGTINLCATNINYGTGDLIIACTSVAATSWGVNCFYEI